MALQHAVLSMKADAAGRQQGLSVRAAPDGQFIPRCGGTGRVAVIAAVPPAPDQAEDLLTGYGERRAVGPVSLISCASTQLVQLRADGRVEQARRCMEVSDIFPAAAQGNAAAGICLSFMREGAFCLLNVCTRNRSECRMREVAGVITGACTGGAAEP